MNVFKALGQNLKHRIIRTMVDGKCHSLDGILIEGKRRKNYLGQNDNLSIVLSVYP